MNDPRTKKISQASQNASKPAARSASRPKKAWQRLSRRTVNVLTALVGVATLLAGIGWMVYDYAVNLEVSYFAIPLVLTVPVIVAVAFRNCWD